MVAIIVVSIILGLSLLLLLIVYMLYRLTFYTPFKKQLNDVNLPVSKNYQSYPKLRRTLVDKFMSRPYEDAYIHSYDGLRLHARVFSIRGGENRVAICFHGYRGTGYRDFCAAAKLLFELKYNVIMIDERGHGLSDGHKITFGIRESKDALDWVKYAKEKFGEDAEILLYGVSLGGHVVLNIADRVDDKVKIIADAPYCESKTSIKNAIRSIHLPVWLVYPLVNLASIMFVHENMNRSSVFNAVKNSNHQILVIHGHEDEVTPYEDSMRLSAKFNSKVRYELFYGAKHITSFLADHKRFERVIKEFLIGKEKAYNK